MSLEQVIQANTNAIQALIAQLQANPVIAFPAASTTTAEVKTDPVVEVEKAVETVAETKAEETQTEAAAPEATREDVQKALVSLSQKQGKPAALAVLESFGASKLPELAEANYGKCLQALNAALAQDNAA